MSKFCTNCGAQLDDAAAFCTNCGASLAAPEAAPAEQYVPEAPVYEETVYEAPAYEAPEAPEAPASSGFDVNGLVEKAKGFPIWLWAVIGGGALTLIIVLIIACSGGAKSALKTYLNAEYKGDLSFKDAKNMAPEAYWEYMEDEYDFDWDDYEEYIKEDYADDFEDMITDDDLEDEYGENIKISYDIVKEKELSEKKVKALAEELNERYDIKKKDVTAAYRFDVEVTIQGDDDEDTEDGEFYVAKIDGDWYVVSEYGNFGTIGVYEACDY